MAREAKVPLKDVYGFLSKAKNGYECSRTARKLVVMSARPGRILFTR